MPGKRAKLQVVPFANDDQTAQVTSKFKMTQPIEKQTKAGPLYDVWEELKKVPWKLSKEDEKLIEVKRSLLENFQYSGYHISTERYKTNNSSTTNVSDSIVNYSDLVKAQYFRFVDFHTLTDELPELHPDIFPEELMYDSKRSRKRSTLTADFRKNQRGGFYSQAYKDMLIDINEKEKLDADMESNSRVDNTESEDIDDEEDEDGGDYGEDYVDDEFDAYDNDKHETTL
jgi:hypothetical protein